MMTQDFEIRKTITEKDIPPVRQKSKYDPLMKSLYTLKKEEGIEVDVKDESVVKSFRKHLKTHEKDTYKRFDVTMRTLVDDRIKMYIIRTQ